MTLARRALAARSIPMPRSTPPARPAVTLVLCVVGLSCGGDGTGVDDGDIASVSVTPATTTLAPGETRQLEATVLNQAGELVNATVSWDTDAPDVAGVNGSGLVIGVAEGSATVTASAGGRVASAAITVMNPILPPRVTTTSLADGGVGTPYSRTLQATEGDGTYAWAVTGGSLPPGLGLDAGTGEISGTPTASGVSNVTVEVTSGGLTDTAELSITVHDALEIDTSALPDGVEGLSYEVALASTGGNGEDTWSLESGALPDGLALSADGAISGTAAAGSAAPESGGVRAAVGTSDFTVRVENTLGQSATRALSITINAVLRITTSGLPGGEVGVAYGQPLVATGGDGSNTWSIASGTLPGGLSLDPESGAITGTPTNPGTSDFTARVTSGDGQVDERALSITVVSGPVTVTTTSLPDGNVGVAYAQALQASGGNGSYAWAITAGALPAGLGLDASTGVISGTPTATGTSGFTVEATSAGESDDQALSLTVGEAPVSIETEYLLLAYPGAFYSQVLEASGGDGSFAWAVTAGSLPAGLSLNGSTGEISGTAGASGAYYFTVTATSGGSAASRTYAVATSTVTADAFNMAIVNVAGSTIPSAAIVTQLGNALARWEGVIVGDLSDRAYGPNELEAGSCAGDGPILNGQVLDDMVILVNLADLDGPGGILAQAGPCDGRVHANPVNLSTTFGRLTLDTSDLAGLSAGQLRSVIFHEIGHIVGIGTFWPLLSLFGGNDLIEGAGTADPRYTGAGGNGVYTGELGGGSSGTETQIPIEADGGPGTRDGHWDEGEFDNEIMTGFAEGSGTAHPISAMTIAAVGDFAYSVDIGVSDPYALPGCAPACPAAPPAPGAAEILLDDVLREPIRLVLPDGTVIWVDPGRDR